MFSLSDNQVDSLYLLWEFEQDIFGIHHNICDEIREFLGDK